jgi:hypothetical protein
MRQMILTQPSPADPAEEKVVDICVIARAVISLRGAIAGGIRGDRLQ